MMSPSVRSYGNPPAGDDKITETETRVIIVVMLIGIQLCFSTSLNHPWLWYFKLRKNKNATRTNERGDVCRTLTTFVLDLQMFHKHMFFMRTKYDACS